AEGRGKINQLEEHLQGLGLRLNDDKTRIMRKTTYENGLHRPSDRVKRLQERLKRMDEEQLLEAEDADFVGGRLSELGVEEETLWDLLYHGTTTVQEVVDSIRDRLGPSISEAYGIFLRELAESLGRGEIPDDMITSER